MHRKARYNPSQAQSFARLERRQGPVLHEGRRSCKSCILNADGVSGRHNDLRQNIRRFLPRSESEELERLKQEIDAELEKRRTITGSPELDALIKRESKKKKDPLAPIVFDMLKAVTGQGAFKGCSDRRLNDAYGFLLLYLRGLGLDRPQDESKKPKKPG